MQDQNRIVQGTRLSQAKSFMVGITIFSMFFGAGNLILPPLLGYQAGEHIFWAFLGFCITAVVLPILALVATSRCADIRHTYDKISPNFSLFFNTSIYLVIGPTLAMPRTATTAFEMMQPLFPMEHMRLILFIFTLVFFGLAFHFAMKPNKLVEYMGRFSGPSLLILIAIILGANILNPPAYTISVAQPPYETNPFFGGFITGYQTMDVLAGIVSGYIVYINVKAQGLTDEKAISRQIGKSGILAGVMMVLIYAGFAYLGIIQGEGTTFTNGAQIIVASSVSQFSYVGMTLVALVFLIACLNVCTSLTSACSTYFSSTFTSLSYRTWALIVVGVSMALANGGLDAILVYSIPLLLAIYPVSLCLLAYGLLPKSDASLPAWRISLGVCLAMSAVSAIRTGFFPDSTLMIDSLPGSAFGLEWVIPTIVVWFIVRLYCKWTSTTMTNLQTN